MDYILSEIALIYCDADYEWRNDDGERYVEKPEL